MVPPRVGLDHACGRAGSSPGASLIICSRNRPQLLLDAVESVLAGEQVPSEIILIDQSDVPNPALKQKQEFRGCWIRYHWTDSRGVSVARNAGAMAAQHDVLVFMDDDMIAPSDWFGTLVLALIRLGHRGVVTGQVAPAAAGGFAPSTKVDPTPALYEGRTGTDILYTGNMALYRATFIEVGGFDERLGPGTAFLPPKTMIWAFGSWKRAIESPTCPKPSFTTRSGAPGVTISRCAGDMGEDRVPSMPNTWGSKTDTCCGAS
jgi:glycosyltransferase involved in cell wall biosynthesis